MAYQTIPTADSPAARAADTITRPLADDGNLTNPPVVTGFARTPAVVNGNAILVYAHEVAQWRKPVAWHTWCGDSLRGTVHRPRDRKRGL